MLVEIGSKHGFWTVISYFGKRSNNDTYNVACKCGKESKVSGYELATGKSSGCKSCRHFKHGMSFSPLYRVWNLMTQRGLNPKNTQWANYGGRGVGVCQEWATDAKSFLDWSLANGYAKGLELDRIDNDKGYSPENCRWVTKKVNNRNKRTNRAIEAFGETKLLVEWEEDSRCVCDKSTLHSRLDYGWSAEDAITRPVQRNARWHGTAA